jgi:GH15 family glucan-1,4-alpha-glucosidase
LPIVLAEQLGAYDAKMWQGVRKAATGKGTESATPLAWTHAQFIRLAWSVQEQKVIEQPTVVRCRYLGC